MYADIFGTIPVAEALLSKALSWVRSVLYDGGYNPVAAFPDYASQGCKTQLLSLFIGICAVGIILVGYLFNAFQIILI